MLSQRIKEERVLINISQERLSKVVGVTQQAIAKWEKGVAEPDGNTLCKLAKFFGTTTDYLLGLANTKKVYQSNDGLTNKELDLIARFRKLSPASQDTVIALIDNLEIVDRTKKEQAAVS